MYTFLWRVVSAEEAFHLRFFFSPSLDFLQQMLKKSLITMMMIVDQGGAIW